MNSNALNALGRRIRGVLWRAKQPLGLDEIASQLGASRYDVHDTLSIRLHGWIEMRHNKYKLL
jgi:DNA-binding transcriptional regulator GbsR (MarR family)